MTAMVGATLKDIESRRDPGEITVYINVDQQGPCQNGAWPLVWETFIKRKRLKNVVAGVWPGPENNRLGLGVRQTMAVDACLLLADAFMEAEFTLRCLARDGRSALVRFETAFQRFVDALEPDDQITSTHRGHGHAIAKGQDIRTMMAELLGKEAGVCLGQGGSMHMADLTLGSLGANGIVAGGIPLSVGAGLSSKLQQSGNSAGAASSSCAATRTDSLPGSKVMAVGSPMLGGSPVRGEIASASRPVARSSSRNRQEPG